MTFVYKLLTYFYLYIYLLIDISVILEVPVATKRTDECILYYNYSLFGRFVLLKVIQLE